MSKRTKLSCTTRPRKRLRRRESEVASRGLKTPMESSGTLDARPGRIMSQKQHTHNAGATVEEMPDRQTLVSYG